MCAIPPRREWSCARPVMPMPRLRRGARHGSDFTNDYVYHAQMEPIPAPLR